MDEKPSESNLDAVYGLKSPETKVTVTVKKDDKTEDWVYSFGKQDEKKNGVYAMVNKSELVFLVPKATVDRLASRRTARPDGVQVRPQAGEGGEDHRLEQRPGRPDRARPRTQGRQRLGQEGRAAIAPDGTKMDSLMRALSNLRASKIVTPKPNTDTGLDVSKKALKIEITIEGGPLELMVGNEDADDKGPDGKPLLFASSNKMAGEVFLLPETVGGVSLKDAKASPAWFRK